MANRRAARVAERIREEASQIILYELQDPRIRGVTISRVDISGDLRHATVYFSGLGDDAAQRTALRGLDSARGLIQSRLGRSLALREARAVNKVIVAPPSLLPPPPRGAGGGARARPPPAPPARAPAPPRRPPPRAPPPTSPRAPPAATPPAPIVSTVTRAVNT